MTRSARSFSATWPSTWKRKTSSKPYRIPTRPPVNPPSHHRTPLRRCAVYATPKAAWERVLPTSYSATPRPPKLPSESGPRWRSRAAALGSCGPWQRSRDRHRRERWGKTDDSSPRSPPPPATAWVVVVVVVVGIGNLEEIRDRRRDWRDCRRLPEGPAQGAGARGARGARGAVRRGRGYR